MQVEHLQQRLQRHKEEANESRKQLQSQVGDLQRSPFLSCRHAWHARAERFGCIRIPKQLESRASPLTQPLAYACMHACVQLLFSIAGVHVPALDLWPADILLQR